MPQRDEAPRAGAANNPDLPQHLTDPATGGTLAGDQVEGGSVIRREGRKASEPLTVPDSIGNQIPVAPELAGTVAGNTTGADVILAQQYQDREPADETEDLGPEGTIIQEVGGEARY